MASIRKRNGRWNVQIRRLTFPLISKTFKDKRLAIKWARGKEYLIRYWVRSSAVEHCLDTAGVTGSIPVAPTIIFLLYPIKLTFFNI
mgnify:CR=1 FL=1